MGRRWDSDAKMHLESSGRRLESDSGDERGPNSFLLPDARAANIYFIFLVLHFVRWCGSVVRAFWEIHSWIGLPAGFCD